MLNPSPVRGWLLAAIALLYLISVPWYRSPEAQVSLWLGLPDWVAVAIACYVAAAALNALAWWRTDLRDAPADEDQGRS